MKRGDHVNGRPALVKGARASRSTIALKLLMAVSGLVFIGFVLLHMYGNLKAFAGHDAFNEYAHHLRTFGEPMLPHEGLLWIIRVVLLGALVVHVYAAVALWRRARKARTDPVRREEAHRRDVRQPADALGRRHAAGVHHLAPPQLHRRQGQRHRRPDQRPLQPARRHFDVWWLTLIYLSRWSRWARTCTTASGAPPRPSASPAPRGRAPGQEGSRSSLALVIPVGFSLVPISVLVGVVD